MDDNVSSKKIILKINNLFYLYKRIVTNMILWRAEYRMSLKILI